MQNPELTARDVERGVRPPAGARPRLGGWWRALALLPVILLAAVLIWREAASPPVELVVAPSVDDPAPQVFGLPTLTEAPPSPSAEPEESATAEVSTGGPSVGGGRPAVPPATTQVVRVRIPSLSVDAPVQAMGLDASGAMEVPYNPGTVAWYGFTAVPGSAGNAVMSGHVDWLGSRAVFYGIRTLQAGDLIEVTTSEGSIRYAVERAYLVRPEEADVAEIVGQRRGPETLTLITCGGTFDRSTRDYDHRVIVRAHRL
jgi:LPXTG-site transpeptidase (sortase) family protein